MSEGWRAVPGYEGLYEVSDHGRVRSQRRPGARGGIKATWRDGHGYDSVLLCRNGRQKPVTVHRLVALAFIGPLPDGLQTRHLDGDKLNNTPGNLAYGSASENMRDQIRHGTHVNTSKTHCPRGHSYSDPDVLVEYKGTRQCGPCTKAKRARRAQRDSVRIPCPACGTVIRKDGLSWHSRRNCRAERAA